MKKFIRKPKPKNMCDQPELTDAYDSLQDIKKRVEESGSNMQTYLKKLNSMYNQADPKKQPYILAEQSSVSLSIKEIDSDLAKLNHIEKALIYACPKIQQKKK